MNDKVYDALKRLAQLGLPAFGALYFGLSQIWGLPYGEEVVGTVAVVNTFLGVVLGYTSKTYHASGTEFDGTAFYRLGGDNPDVHLELKEDWDVLTTKDRITFKVEHAN